MPDIPGIELAVSSDEMFDLPAFPERLVIVGGGYIACEFACIMQGLGAQVTQLYRRDLPLRGFDYDLRAVLCEEMRKGGVDLRLNTNAAALDRTGSAIAVATTTGETIEADQVLFATGRKPNVAGLGLENAGIATAEGGAVPVDAASHSGVAGIYAVGDVTDRINLTPVAIHEGRCIAETLYNNNPQKPDHRDIATAVFTTPELGTVGLSEEEARQAFPAVDIYKTRFRPLKHTLTGREETIFMKLVAERASGRVVGCHMVGDGAGEAVQLLGVAVKAGATKAQFDATMAVHPTAAEEFVTMYEPVPETASPSRPGVRPASNNSGKCWHGGRFGRIARPQLHKFRGRTTCPARGIPAVGVDCRSSSSRTGPTRSRSPRPRNASRLRPRWSSPARRAGCGSVWRGSARAAPSCCRAETVRRASRSSIPTPCGTLFASSCRWRWC